jgi:alpha-tubulin suppressor-like RCC1 family protein
MKFLKLFLSLYFIAFVFTCTSPQNPFTQDKAEVFLHLESSAKIASDSTITDTVGNTIRIGTSFFMPDYFDSVIITVNKSIQEMDTFFICKKSDIKDDTTWFEHAFKNEGIRTVTATGYVEGGNKPSATATITVIARPLPPDSVRGLAAVARTNGTFIFKWNSSAAAAQYLIYRSKDTTGFAQYATVQDTTFTNIINDTAFYYYIVASNSNGISAPSQQIRSTATNTPPKWSHSSIAIAISEGASFSFNCADSCKDTNGDAVSFQLVSADTVHDSLIGSIWKYSPSYTDSGSHTLKIKAWDGTDSSILTIALHVVNVPRPPQPQPQNLSTNRNAPLAITLTAIDPDGDAITKWVIDTQTTHGTVTITNSAQPTATYTPATNFMGNDYFTFKASVGSLTSIFSTRISILVDTNNIAPVISQKLSAMTLTKGDSLVLTVAVNANAFPAPLYSWYKTGSFLDSTRTNSWKKLNVQGTDSGFYHVIVSNIAGRDSSGAAVTVNVPPTITTQPLVLQTAIAGSPDTLSVVASGVPAPTYQWKKNGGAIGGATARSYVIPVTSTNDTGTYTVTVSNSLGSVTSTACVLVVNTPVAITMPPVSQAIHIGKSVTFRIAATGTAPLHYQWKKAGSQNMGSDADSLTISNLTLNDSNTVLTCAVSNVCGQIISAACTLSVVRVLKVAGGYSHSIMLMSDGTVWACGRNRFGELGDGTTTQRLNPVQVMISATAPLINVVDVATGSYHSLFLLKDGTVCGCGTNSVGQLGIGNTTKQSFPVKMSIVSNAKNIAAGYSHSLILTNDGTLYACGDNSFGQLGLGASTNELVPDTMQTGVLTIAAGDYHSLILLSARSISAFGRNDNGQLGINNKSNQNLPVSVINLPGVSGTANMAGGYDFSLFLAASGGDLYGCGNNNVGQLGIDTLTITDTAAPVHIMTGVKNIAAGLNHSLILKTDGTLMGCGYNAYGELGDNTSANHSTPFQMATNVESIAAGYYATLMVKSDGTLWVCGQNTFGQLGDGTINNAYVPKKITF